MLFKIKDFTSYSFIYSVCVTLSTPALIYLTTISWSKGIDTLLHISHPDQFELPSFTICSDFRFLLDFEKIKADSYLYKHLNQFFNTKNITENQYKNLDTEDVIKFLGMHLNISDLLLYTKNLNQVLESISVYGVINLPQEDQNLDNEQIGEKYCPKM